MAPALVGGVATRYCARAAIWPAACDSDSCGCAGGRRSPSLWRCLAPLERLRSATPCSPRRLTPPCKAPGACGLPPLASSAACASSPLRASGCGGLSALRAACALVLMCCPCHASRPAPLAPRLIWARQSSAPGSGCRVARSWTMPRSGAPARLSWGSRRRARWSSSSRPRGRCAGWGTGAGHRRLCSSFCVVVMPCLAGNGGRVWGVT